MPSEITGGMLTAACDKRRAASLEVTLLSLRWLAETAREFNAGATYLIFEGSDQGDFLSAMAVHDAEDQVLDEDRFWDKFDAQAVDWNLGYDCQSQWEDFMVDADTKGEVVKRTRGYSMNIEKALAIPIPYAYLPTLEVVVTVDEDGDVELTCPTCGSEGVKEVSKGISWTGLIRSEVSAEGISLIWDSDFATGTDFEGEGHICTGCLTKLELPDEVEDGRPIENNYV